MTDSSTRSGPDAREAAGADRIRVVASILGADLLLGVIALGMFFAIGGPFGAINDWTIAIAGVLNLLLVVVLAERDMRRTRTDILANALAIVGSVTVVVGALLVISRTSGFLLAGLVESFGFALIGIWLVASALSTPQRLPGRQRRLGILAGLLMAIGLIVAPAIVGRVDDMDTAPAFVWIGFVGWVGIFLVYPIWCLSVGLRATS